MISQGFKFFTKNKCQITFKKNNYLSTKIFNEETKD